MKHISYARKQRQLRHLVKSLKTLSTDSRHHAQQQVETLVRKIKALVKELSSVLAPFHLKRILAPAALMLGISVGTPAAAQSFAAPQENPFGITSLQAYAIPAVADLDGDGDLDLLAGDANDNGGRLMYYKNTGTSTNPQFAAPVQDPFGINVTSEYVFPALADLDHDGDTDLLVGDDNGILRYFKNTGTAANPQFAAPVTNPFGLVALEEFALASFADIDGDGDLDLLVGEYGGVMQYFRNQGTVTNPQFAAPQQNPFGLTSTMDVSFPAFADLDNDGDLDLLVGEYYGKMQYFKNTGSSTNPQFAAPVENPFGLVDVYSIASPAFADLDGDGDMDLLVGEYYGDIQYFKNTSPVGTQEQYANISLRLHPNPVADVLNFQTDMPFEKIEAYDAMGKLFRNYHGALTSINTSDWNSGAYLLKFIDSKGGFVTRKVMKE